MNAPSAEREVAYSNVQELTGVIAGTYVSLLPPLPITTGPLSFLSPPSSLPQVRPARVCRERFYAWRLAEIGESPKARDLALVASRPDHRTYIHSSSKSGRSRPSTRSKCVRITSTLGSCTPVCNRSGNEEMHEGATAYCECVAMPRNRAVVDGLLLEQWLRP